jgi:hypothetical protein
MKQDKKLEKAYDKIIPKELLGDILEIYNFLNSFNLGSQNIKLTKEILYIALSYDKDNKNILLVLFFYFS